MQNRGLSSLLEYLRRELPLPGPDLVPDDELITRFIDAKDQAAFELLVRRHGPMVFGVARRMLRDEHAAEDVLQATFLALARQAKSLPSKHSIAGWLYRVAVRISTRARSKKLVAVTDLAHVPAPKQDHEQNELKATLDTAIERLPEKLRRAVVLCYLSGYTTEQAGRLLECPKGTVLSRLAAAREKLQSELTRKGIVVSAATLSATLTTELTSAALPSAVVAIAMKAIGPAAALTPIVITLAQGAIAMSWIKMTFAGVASLTVTLGLATVFAGPGPQQQSTPKTVQKPEQVPSERREEDGPPLPKEFVTFQAAAKLSWDRSEPDLLRLRKQRAMAALRELELRVGEFYVGRGDLGALIDCAQRTLQSRIEAGPTKAEYLNIYETYQKFVAGLEDLQRARFEAGSIKQQDFERVHFLNYTAQLDLVKAKQQVGANDKK